MISNSLRTLFVLLVGVALLPLPGKAVVHNINVGNFFFSPTNTVVNYGDTVRWTWVGGTHNTISDPSSTKSWASPTQSSGTFEIVINPGDGPGPMPYTCTLHPASMRDTLWVAGGLFNAQVSVSALPFTDQVNSSIAISETVPSELYSVYTNFPSGSAAPTFVSYSYSLGAGAPGTFVDAFKPPDNITGTPYTEEWNPSISAVYPAGGFIMVGAQRVGGPYAGGANAIVMNYTAGGGAGFGAGVAVNLTGSSTTCFDFPVVEVDDDPGSASPGNAHILYNMFADVTGGDTDGNGNRFDDPGDIAVIWHAYTDFGGVTGPAYPAVGIFPWASPAITMAGGPLATYRAAIDIVGGLGTPVIPAGGIYIAYIDALNGMIMLDANPGPSTGGAFGVFGPNPVPILPIVPLPPVINGPITGPIQASSAVTIAVANGPGGPCTGGVCVAWSDYGTGDADILFARSLDGGFTWSAPIRVNTDPVGNGLDQWAPHMRIDDVTGEIVITYYDRRSDPGNSLIEVWSSSSLDCGNTWVDCVVSGSGPTLPVSNTPFPGAWFIGDYLGTDHNAAFGMAMTWNDGRSGWEQDVYFETAKACDSEGDGVPDIFDNCPTVLNPGQADTDSDSWGDACDCDPGNPNIYPGAPELCNGVDDNCNGPSDEPFGDGDSDGWGDSCDNCPATFNPSQADSNSNGIGDACESTSCCVGVKGNIDCDPLDQVNLTDLTTLVNSLFVTFAPLCCPDEADIDGNGIVNLTDLTLLVNSLFVTFTPLPPC